MNYYQRQQLRKALLFSGGICLIIIFLSILIINIFFSQENAAEKAIHEFYRLEEAGDFGQSWEMFHPVMQAKIPKKDYVQDRPHVFLNHFGIDSFRTTFGKVKKLNNWKVEKESKTLNDVFMIPITMHIMGKYGTLDIQQDVYTVKVEDDWRIMWDYEK